jgi:hypothetical protein
MVEAAGEKQKPTAAKSEQTLWQIYGRYAFINIELSITV